MPSLGLTWVACCVNGKGTHWGEGEQRIEHSRVFGVRSPKGQCPRPCCAAQGPARLRSPFVTCPLCGGSSAGWACVQRGCSEQGLLEACFSWLLLAGYMSSFKMNQRNNILKQILIKNLPQRYFPLIS